MRSLVIAAVALITACSATTTPTTAARPTRTTVEEPLQQLSEAVDELRRLDEWRDSAERRAGLDAWRSQLRDLMTQYIVRGRQAGEFPAGECQVRLTGVFVACEVTEWASDELQDAEFFGACPSYLVAFGCRSLDDHLDPLYRAFLERP